MAEIAYSYFDQTMGKSGPLLLLRTKSPGEQQKWTTYHKSPMKNKFRGPSLAHFRQFFSFFHFF